MHGYVKSKHIRCWIIPSHADNAVYSANEGAFSSDYQEIGSTISSNPTLATVRPENHYEVEHTYELAGTNSSVEMNYYAGVGPQQDSVSKLQCSVE